METCEYIVYFILQQDEASPLSGQLLRVSVHLSHDKICHETNVLTPSAARDEGPFLLSFAMRV